MTRPAPARTRRAFTLIEVAASLGVLAAAAALVAQLAVWAMAERSRSDARLDAADAAANVLEEARALPWKDLTAEWAAARKMPDHLAARWPDGRLTARVVPEADRPGVKRVTVEVTWTGRGNRPSWPSVALTGLFADRPAEGKS